MHIVFGGAFNPPTLAHLKIVFKLLDLYQEASILMLPVGDDYRKTGLVSFKHRFQMLELMFKDVEKVHVLDLENRRPYQGTLQSLNELAKTYSNLYFVIGADNLHDFESWINYETLLKSYPFIIISRNQGPTQKNIEMMFAHLEHRFIWVDLDESISSSKFREQPHKCINYVDSKVCKYIMKNKLYEV